MQDYKTDLHTKASEKKYQAAVAYSNQCQVIGTEEVSGSSQAKATRLSSSGKY